MEGGRVSGLDKGPWGPGGGGSVHAGLVPSGDPPLPVGAPLRGAGVQHTATVAEGETTGLPVLCEHCRGRREGSRGSRAGHLLTPHRTPHSPAVLCAPPSPPIQVQPPTSGRSPDPPGLPGLLLEGALGGGLSPLPRGPCVSGALVARVTGVTEVTGFVGVPGVTVALGSGGSVRFWEGQRGLRSRRCGMGAPHTQAPPAGLVAVPGLVSIWRLSSFRGETKGTLAVLGSSARPHPLPSCRAHRVRQGGLGICPGWGTPAFCPGGLKSSREALRGPTPSPQTVGPKDKAVALMPPGGGPAGQIPRPPGPLGQPACHLTRRRPAFTKLEPSHVPQPTPAPGPRVGTGRPRPPCHGLSAHPASLGLGPAGHQQQQQEQGHSGQGAKAGNPGPAPRGSRAGVRGSRRRKQSGQGRWGVKATWQ